MSKIKKSLIALISRSQRLKLLCVKVTVGVKRLQYQVKYAHRYPVQEHLIVFEAFTGRQYSCNPRALYEELLKNPEYRSYKKIWAFQDPENYRDLEQDKNTKVVKYKSPAYYQAYAMAGIWVSNFRIPHELQPKKNQIYLQTWHGTPLKRLVFDIKDYKDANSSREELEYHCTQDVRRYRYMLAPSEFYKEKLTSAFHLKQQKKEDIFIMGGYPRNDYLFHFTEEETQRIRRTLGLPEGKQVILYAPTWRESEHRPGEGYGYQLAVDFKRWQETIGDQAVVLFRCHYLISSSFDFTPYRGFVWDVSGYDEINRLYAISDLLITDYSSVFFDFANLRRPMLFYMYDYETYKNEMRDFYLDEAELPGSIVKDEEALLQILKTGVDESAYAERYREFNEKYNPYTLGDGSRVVWEHILGE